MSTSHSIHLSVVAAMVALVSLSAPTTTRAAAPLRAGVFIGSNQGLFDEEDLFYAHEDATKMHGALATWGGLEPRLSTLLEGASREDVLAALDELRERIWLLSEQGGRSTECVFYYSGHGGTDGLHLAGRSLGWDELHSRLQGLGCELLVVVLDACQSGALFDIDALRLKGLTFSADEFRVRVWDSHEGQVFITSAAATEFAQEKDELRGSVFTHHFVRGLLGAADRDDDLRVTLGEAYDFASRRTSQDTFGSARGFQMPAFRYDVHGSHDVVLTTLTDRRQTAAPPGRVEGTLTFMDRESGVIWGDFAAGVRPEPITVPGGRYTVRLRAPDGGLSLATCRVTAGGTAEWGRFEAIAADDDPLKGSRRHHHVDLRLTGGLALSPDGTAAPRIGWGGGVALTVDGIGIPPLYVGASFQVRTGVEQETAFDLDIERRSTSLVAHALVGLEHRFGTLLALAGELRLGGGWVTVRRNLPSGARSVESGVFDAGVGAHLTWWLSPDIGLAVPSLTLSALTYERGGSLHATLDSTLHVGLRLRF